MALRHQHVDDRAGEECHPNRKCRLIYSIEGHSGDHYLVGLINAPACLGDSPNLNTDTRLQAHDTAPRTEEERAMN